MIFTKQLLNFISSFLFYKGMERVIEKKQRTILWLSTESKV